MLRVDAAHKHLTTRVENLQENDNENGDENVFADQHNSALCEKERRSSLPITPLIMSLTSQNYSQMIAKKMNDDAVSFDPPCMISFHISHCPFPMTRTDCIALSTKGFKSTNRVGQKDFQFINRSVTFLCDRFQAMFVFHRIATLIDNDPTSSEVLLDHVDSQSFERTDGYG
jgi:hypothetical protein